MQAIIHEFRQWKLLWPLAAVAILSTAAINHAHADAPARITIQKGAGNTNPSIALVRFQGPNSAERRFLHILRTADWFTVQKDDSGASYRLQVAYAHNDEKARVQLTIQGPSAKKIKTTLTQTGAQAHRRILYQAVDRLIQHVFRQPGPCYSRIAFVAATDGKKEIFTSNFDLTDIKQLTNNSSISTEPAWGNRGERLVYTLYQSHGTHIVLADVSQNRQKTIVAQPGLNAGADIDRANNRIVLARSHKNQVDLFIKDLRSGKFKQLTDDSHVESSPCWIPEKNQVCYVSDAGGQPQIHMVDVSTGRSRLLVNDYAQSVSPDWSPLSGEIIFSAKHKGHYVIAKTDPAANDKPEIVIQDPGDWEAPNWGPDGRHAVCTHTEEDMTRIVIIDTRHGTVTPLSKPGEFALPVWTEKTTH